MNKHLEERNNYRNKLNELMSHCVGIKKSIEEQLKNKEKIESDLKNNWNLTLDELPSEIQRIDQEMEQLSKIINEELETIEKSIAEFDK